MEHVETNRHHILHYDEYWNANKYNRKLRQSMGLIALMRVESHRDTHANCPAPPPLDPYTAQRAFRLYIPDQDPLKGIDNFSFAVEEALKHPRTYDIERQVGLLAIDAVRLQIPFIKEGLVPEHFSKYKQTHQRQRSGR